ncbi:MAG: PilT/PilU family type 4a pilus ATPase [Bacteroidota bacterium]
MSISNAPQGFHPDVQGTTYVPPSKPNAPAEAQRLRLPKQIRLLARSAPRTLVGVDRLRFYAEHVGRFDPKMTEHLRRYMEQFIGKMIELDASDLDLGGPATAGRVWYRVSGDKKPDAPLGTGSTDETDILILSMLNDRQREDLLKERSADFSYSMDAGGETRRFRATTYFDLFHLGLCMRAINNELRSLKGQGFHPAIIRGMMFSKVRDGLTLVTGVTGSGKSSTLDAVIDANNQDFDGHIVIIGKPVEFMHTPKRCIVRHRDVGSDVHSFKHGVIQALRQDPDIIVIGEMRDPETISSAIEAADTGHKVFSTLHTASAIESIDRIVAEFPPNEQNRIRIRLADTLRCVISQKLAPRLGGGRVLVKEVLWMTPSTKAAIYNDNAGEIYQMMWEGGHLGMTTLEQDLLRLLREKKISRETALNFANNKRRLKQII